MELLGIMVSNAPSGTKIHLCSRSCFSKGVSFSTKASLAAESQGPVFLFHHKGFARSHTQPLFPPLIHLQYHRDVPDHSALATEMLPLQQGPAFLFWTYAMMAVWGVAFPGMEYTIPCTPDIESPSPRWKVEDSVVFFFILKGYFCTSWLLSIWKLFPTYQTIEIGWGLSLAVRHMDSLSRSLVCSLLSLIGG